MAARGLRAGLELLSDLVAEQSRRFAAEMMLLAELTAMVPRCPFDEQGPTPWTSFRREVAVARKVSDRAAAADIRVAVALATRMPRTLELLGQARVTVQRARAFVTELEGVADEVALAVDEQLAERICKLSVTRIQQETRKAVLKADPDESARRTADKNDGRDVLLLPDTDDQASLVIAGPAVPVTRWYATLDKRARALKADGDPRTLAQLRFDLAVAGYPCAVHAPATDRAAAAPGLRPSFVEPAGSDCRMSRPVQARIAVPVETGLGLSNEPGWLDGYGWISAPTCRLLLVDAELRRICVRSGTGELVERAERDVRPPPTFIGLRHALVDMVVTTSLSPAPAGASRSSTTPVPACASTSSCATAMTTDPPAV